MNKIPKIRTVLIGTSGFATTIFEKLWKAKLPNFKIVGVITAPDKPTGRKQILTPSPVKKWAQQNNLLVLQPEKIADPEQCRRIKELSPDLIILTAYGQILPKTILKIPKYGALNIHPSLLPKYRGASPIQATILNGDRETGVTIILMDEKIDHGNIISKSSAYPQAGKFLISNKITYKELERKLADLGANLLIATLPDYVNGKIKPEPQDHSKATFCKIIKKEDGKIDWNKSAEEIERQIRAYAVWPTAYTEIPNPKSSALPAGRQILNKLKILNAKIQNKNTNHKIGEVFLVENKELAVQTGNGILILKQVQLEGKKPMTAKDFLNGHPKVVGIILGD